MSDLKIFTEDIEEKAVGQISTLLGQPAFKNAKVRIMPDVHAGAGRLLARGEAKRTLDLEEFKKSMEGIYTTTVNESTIDESPMVYKPAQEIIDAIQDTVTIDKIIKPVYNFKAGEE